MRHRLFLALLLALALPAQQAAAAEYRIRPERSELVVLVFKAGFASALGHDHVVRAAQFTGSVAGDPGTPAGAAIRLIVPVAALVADEPEVRKKHGLSGELSDSDRQEIQSTMRGEKVLDAARHPEIAFRSVSVEPRGPDQFLLTGDLTLHGTTRRLTFPVTARLSGPTLHATGAFEFNQSDFAITPLSLFLGAVKNQDRVRILFDLVAEP
jgi:polyisoprenoid-binding protein YceI